MQQKRINEREWSLVGTYDYRIKQHGTMRLAKPDISIFVKDSFLSSFRIPSTHYLLRVYKGKKENMKAAERPMRCGMTVQSTRACDNEGAATPAVFAIFGWGHSPRGPRLPPAGLRGAPRSVLFRLACE